MKYPKNAVSHEPSKHNNILIHSLSFPSKKIGFLKEIFKKESSLHFPVSYSFAW
jgi:hypothetical protein